MAEHGITEQEAIQRLKHGDISGLEMLVKTHQVRATQTAFLITGDWTLAEDIVQSAFIQVYDKIEQFDSQRPFRPWFLRSVANSAIDALTQQKRTVSLDFQPNSTQSLDELLAAPDLTDDADTRQAVWSALSKLAPAQRAAIVLRYFLDLSEEEMSREMTVPAGTVKWRLYAARKHLRSLLKGYGE